MAKEYSLDEFDKLYSSQPSMEVQGDFTFDETGLIQELPKPVDGRGKLQKVGDFVNKIFPGKRIGEDLGTSIATALAKPEVKPFVDQTRPTKGQLLGDAVGAATLVGSVAAPGAGSIVKTAAQFAGLGAIGAGAQSAADGGGVRDIYKSAMLGGTIGGVLGGTLGVAGKTVSTLTKRAPAKIYNTAIKTPLPDTKKAIMFNGKTLGEELVRRGVKGSDEGLFKRAISEIEINENKLQGILSKSNKTISRNEIAPYLDDLINTKQATPGLADEVEKIKSVLMEFPENIKIDQANQVKRNLYKALDDIAFKVDPNLSTKKEAMKAVAKGIKAEIEKKTADEVGDGVVRGINQELAVFGKLKDRALDKIARANKNNLLGLGDMFAMGSGAAVGAATGGGAIVGGAAFEGAKRAAGSTGVMSRAAVGLDRLGNLIEKLPTDSAGRVSKAAVIKLLSQLGSKQD